MVQWWDVPLGLGRAVIYAAVIQEMIGTSKNNSTVYFSGKLKPLSCVAMYYIHRFWINYNDLDWGNYPQIAFFSG